MRNLLVAALTASLLGGCQVSQAPVATTTPQVPLASVTPTPKAPDPSAPEFAAQPTLNPDFVKAVVNFSGAVAEGVVLRAYEMVWADLLSRERFQELETMIESQRLKQELFSSGGYKLTAIYYSLESSRGTVPGNNHLYHMWRLLLWQRQMPKSAAAKIALARALMVFSEGKLPIPEANDYAFCFRHHPELHQYFRDTGKAAVELLAAARALAPHDPEGWALSLKTARILKAPSAEFEALRVQALKRFPNYIPIWGQVIQQELATDPSFAWWQVKLSSSDLVRAYNYSATIPMTASAWPTYRQGALDLIEQDPQAYTLRSKLARLAMEMGDEELARSQLEAINFNLERIGAWHPPATLFVACQKLGVKPGPALRPPLPLDSIFQGNQPRLRRTLLEWQVEFLLTGGRVAELDAVGDAFRKNKQKLADGNQLLACWYEALLAPRFERNAEEQIALFRSWLEVCPNSYDVRFCLAKLLLDKAWEVRGGGWASEVTESQWDEFHRDHSEAVRLFDELQSSRPALDPWAASLGISLCRNREDGKATAYQLFQRAQEYDPTALELYLAMGVLLLPRWAGDQGELATFIRQSDQQHGPGVYGVVASGVSKLSGVAEEEGFSDAKILKSFSQLARARKAPLFYNLYLAQAIKLRDRAATRDAMHLVGSNWDRGHFLNSEVYRAYQDWAIHNQPFPSL